MVDAFHAVEVRQLARLKVGRRVRDIDESRHHVPPKMSLEKTHEVDPLAGCRTGRLGHTAEDFAALDVDFEAQDRVAVPVRNVEGPRVIPGKSMPNAGRIEDCRSMTGECSMLGLGQLARNAVRHARPRRNGQTQHISYVLQVTMAEAPMI